MTHERWQQHEIEALAAFYPAISAQNLQRLVAGRSAKAIGRQADRMGIKKCHERLREMGRENVNRRWAARSVFREPDSPST